ncbi:MAG: hypothetical protein KBT29_02205 [Prevotellaceae bacterium]|nr:hypothetical protein [Candidatus Minthosoma caballi]
MTKRFSITDFKMWKVIVLILTLYSSLFTPLRAQDVTVTVTPVQQILPPQVLLYLSNPGKYFTVQLTNTSATAQEVYIGMQIQQTLPASGLSITTPPRRQPSKPFVVPANGVYQLTSVDMKNLFNHIPANEISCPPGLFDSYSNGSFGLLPEGEYQAHLTAYKWKNPQYAAPVVASNPSTGKCNFKVCYTAQAPNFLMPMLMGGKDSEVAEIDPMSAQFSWTQPTIACGNSFSLYTYDFKVVELLKGQQPDYAMDHNPIVFQSKGLVSPLCVIPSYVLTTKFNTEKTYIAQITAISSNTNALNYILINNNGKSTYRMFKIKSPVVNNDENSDDNDDEDEEEEGDDWILMGNKSLNDSIYTDSLYAFRNPMIITPSFDFESTARKVFIENDIDVTWRKVWHLGGEGEHPDELKFDYEVQLFDGGPDAADLEATLETKPVYTVKVKDGEELKATIPWEDIKEKVEVGDYIVLRVQPTCTNGKSIEFVNDTCNIRDFALTMHYSKEYFKCSSMVEISNFEPTAKTAKDLKGATIAMGEYQLTLDEIEDDNKVPGSFKGKGRVEWTPLGASLMVCVKFDTLQINTDDIAYGGLCVSVPDPAAGNNGAIVDKLFSEYGLDNLLADSNIPYAKDITSEAKGLAKQVDISDYYEYYRTGKGAVDLLTSGKVDELYLPIKVPKSLNTSPVDLQIGSMRFAPTWATMDVIGQFALDDSKYTDNEILMFGAPRLCMSPETYFPESGTVALLGDLEIKDPNSSYTIKFKAPQDLLEPTDGCYIAWHDYKFEILGIECDMTIPKLKKDVNGEMSKDNAILTFKTSFSEWDDWEAKVSIDPFQVEDLPGWTFTATDIIYDHSLYRNSSSMGKFPTEYKRSKNADLVGQDDTAWRGLYIKAIGIEFPKAFEFGKSSDKRLKIQATDMFFDASGVTLAVGADNVFSAETGKLGGWKFSLDKAYVQFIQSNFNKCYIQGQIGVPLLKTKEGKRADLDYYCEIRKQIKSGKETNNTAYIFTVQQMDDEMDLDLFLAKVKFQKNLTYLAVEAETSASGPTETKVELKMGGNMTIGGTEKLEGLASSKLGIEIDIPDIHFVGLRIANCNATEWKSEYAAISKLQKASQEDNTKILLNLYDGKTISSGNFYFDTGAWSLASLEKRVGPFEFSLTNYKIEKDDKSKSDLGIKLSLAGKVGLVKGVDISAMAAITLKAGMNGLKDFSNIEAEFDEIKLDSCGLHTSFCGITLDGKLVSADDEAKGKGFSGDITVALPGDIFRLDMTGGYFKHKGTTDIENYTWGYMYVAMKGKEGIPIPPVQINGISGGFYFNCKSSTTSPKEVTPTNGAIGIILGIDIATIGADDLMSGHFDMTVAYDKNRDGQGKGGLTQFLFKGKLTAMGGFIDNNMTIIYENTAMDEYFQLTLTVDTKVNNTALLKQVNSMAGDLPILQPLDFSKIEEGEQKSNKQNKASGEPQTNNKEQKETAELGKAKLSLDVKITRKQNGKKLDKVKWHVYLGEPAEDKRCSLTLISFKSKVVTLVIGANAYMCMGNELPNDGQLPPIPDKIAKFLDGSSKGYTQSDGIGAANSARAQAKANFGGSVAGGVMFGAQVYGYLDVNLGIIGADIDALAGFDISLRKLKGAVCVNTNGHPGYNEWYGQGQLYAYFAASLNIHINLGFYKDDFKLAGAQIGGVLEMGGPNPTYFMGKLRAKVNLLGGLVSFNKKFEFECGNTCQLFVGNPLDNFKLFDKCSLGDTIRAQMWKDDNKISSEIFQASYVNTNAPLEQHFRVLDENEFNRIAKDYNGDANNLKIQAERTFVFRANDYIMLYEYSDSTKYNEKTWKQARQNNLTRSLMPSYYQPYIFYYDDKSYGNNYSNSYKITFSGGNPQHRVLDLATLRKYIKPNKYYRLEICGRAFELAQGQEVDPVTFDKEKSKYVNKPWIQYADYFFSTKPDEAFADTCDLHKYIAIAYPSNYNKLNDGIKDGDVDNYRNVYYNDAAAPTIALTKDISKTAYNKGKLYWILRRSDGRELERSENAWVTTESTCNMEPQYKFKKVSSGEKYILCLDYVTYSASKGQVQSDTLHIGKQHISVLHSSNTWRTGSTQATDGGEPGHPINLAYERPFCAARLSGYGYDGFSISSTYDKAIAMKDVTLNGKMARYYDPFFYIGYLSNFAFIGGWRVDTDKLGLDVTTSQSVILNVPGAGKYEGTLANSTTASNIWNDRSKIRNMFFYDLNQYQPGYGNWPLPEPTDGVYDYLLSTDKRAYRFLPSQNGSFTRYIWYVTNDIVNKYNQVDNFQQRIYNQIVASASYMSNLIPSKFGENDLTKAIKSYVEWKRGTFVVSGSSDTKNSEQVSNYTLSVPSYQFGLLWGSMYLKLSNMFPQMSMSHPRAFLDIQLYQFTELSRLTFMNVLYSDPGKQIKGTQNYYNPKTVNAVYPSGQTLDIEAAKKLITSGLFYVYRVNGYDFKKGQYTVLTNLQNGSGCSYATVNTPLSSPSVKGSVNNYTSNTTSTTKGTINSVISAASTTASSSNTTSYDSYLKTIVDAKQQIMNYSNNLEAKKKSAKKCVDNAESAWKTTKNYAVKAMEATLQASINTYTLNAKAKLTSVKGYKEDADYEKATAMTYLRSSESYLSQAEKAYNYLKINVGYSHILMVNATHDIELCRQYHHENSQITDEVIAFDDKALYYYNDAKSVCNKLATATQSSSKTKVATYVNNSAIYKSQMKLKVDSIASQLTYSKGLKNYATTYFNNCEKAYNNYLKYKTDSYYQTAKEECQKVTFRRSTGIDYCNKIEGIRKRVEELKNKVDQQLTDAEPYTFEGTKQYTSMKNNSSTALSYLEKANEDYETSLSYSDEIARLAGLAEEYVANIENDKRKTKEVQDAYTDLTYISSTVSSKRASLSKDDSQVTTLLNGNVASLMTEIQNYCAQGIDTPSRAASAKASAQQSLEKMKKYVTDFDSYISNAETQINTISDFNSRAEELAQKIAKLTDSQGSYYTVSQTRLTIIGSILNECKGYKQNMENSKATLNTKIRSAEKMIALVGNSTTATTTSRYIKLATDTLAIMKSRYNTVVAYGSNIATAKTNAKTAYDGFILKCKTYVRLKSSTNKRLAQAAASNFDSYYNSFVTYSDRQYKNIQLIQKSGDRVKSYINSGLSNAVPGTAAYRELQSLLTQCATTLDNAASQYNTSLTTKRTFDSYKTAINNELKTTLK